MTVAPTSAVDLIDTFLKANSLLWCRRAVFVTEPAAYSSIPDKNS